jgi:ribosomal protein S18 acetylase RimI-like enzyme
MSDKTRILVRNARDQDIPAVAEIDAEAFSPYGTAEKPETFQLRLTAFPDGFVVLVADNEIAGFGCSEKWLTEREPGLDENPLTTHQPEGRIFCITSMAVKMKYRGRGYGLRILDKLIETAHSEGCRKIVLETTHAHGLFLKRGFKTVQNRTERGISLDVMSLDIESYGSKA